MENNTEENKEENTEKDIPSPYSSEERFQSAIRGFTKPKNGFRVGNSGGITNEEKKKRELSVRKLVKAGLSLEQIVDFLPNWGIKLSYSQVDAYYKKIADSLMPSERRYYEKRKKNERSQEFQDFLEFLWYTGCRPQEACRVELRHVRGDKIMFPASESK